MVDAAPAGLLYILLSTAFIPLAGMQNDEALFAAPLYQGMIRDLRLFHHDLQLMAMSYVGTLKTFLWAPVLHLFGGSVWAVRLPAVLLSSVTILFFHRLLKIAGVTRLAALLCALMLATDPVFLLTNTFDWGPVALEHFLVATACFCLFKGAKDGRDWLLYAGFFLLGLALWNKAIFVWSFAGLIAGALIVFAREIRTQIAWPRVGFFAASFALGASPFLFYNYRHRNATFHDNAHFDSPSSAFSKWIAVKNTANGNGLFGYMVEEEWDDHPKEAPSVLGRASVWLREHIGAHRESGLYWFYLALPVAIPLWWKSRMAWFSVIFCAVTWASMAFTRDAGGSLHHTILLWPFPLLLAAAVFARLPGKILLPVGGLLVLSNLLVLNQYFVQFERFGAARDFTDALFPLARAVPQQANVWVVDWGMYNSLLMSHQKRELLHTGNEPFMDDSPMSPDQLKQAHRMLDDHDAVFVGHAPGKEVFEGVQARLEKYAAKRDLRKQLIEAISDSNGRPLFEIFRFLPSPP